MSRVFRKRLTGVLAVVTALAVPGGGAAILATSGGGATSVLAATAGWTPTAGPTAGATVISCRCPAARRGGRPRC